MPDTHGAMITASVTASTGGVSIRTQSNGPFCTFEISVFIRSEASSSDGFGGVRPAVITHRFCTLVRRIACRAVACPVSRCDSPMVFSMPSVRETLGRRMSASISSTRDPPYASAIAMLQAVVVLPSSGCALVRPMTRVPSLPLLKTSDVRSARNASPNSCGTSCESSG